MEPYLFYLVTSGVFLSVLAISFTYVNDRFLVLHGLLKQKLSNEHTHTIKESVVIDALSHLSKKIDQTNARIESLPNLIKSYVVDKVQVEKPQQKDYSTQTKSKIK